MRTIIFLGKFFPKSLIRTVVEDSKGKIGMSNHNFEMSIINGLCAQKDISLHCITIPGVYSFPHNNKRFITPRESYKYKEAFIESISFVNLPIVKEILSTIGLAVKIVKVVRKCSGDRIDVIVNTPDNRLLRGLSLARYFIPKRMTQTVIIPDVPSVMTQMSDKINPIKRLVLKCIDRAAMKMTSKSDGLVVLTEAMMDFVGKPVPYVVMEGIVDVESMMGEPETSSKEIILYTGTLRKIFGIMNLVQAFQTLVDEDVELWICGSGDCEGAVNEAANRDSRIKFFGLVDSQTSLRMQRQATILVNPRTSEGEYTKYSFPSKTMEYLLSGKSVIINRLSSIPEEYYQYVYTPENESIDALAECISKVLAEDVDVRTTKSQSGRNFIIFQKNSRIQTRRILEMIAEYK